MTAKTDDKEAEMRNALTTLWNHTSRDADPKHKGRVYIKLQDGTTAHGVVGGDSKTDIESTTLEEMPEGAELVKVEQYEEGSINHPLR